MGISFKQVSHTFTGVKKDDVTVAINDINLDINEKNEFVAIVGKTGSGKSTLLQHMNGLVLPTSGVVEIFDNVITPKKRKNPPLKNVRKKVGFVFQFPEYQLFEETVLKDVSFGPKNYKLDNPEEKAKKAMESLHLGEAFYDKHPLLLSGGEMRKVAISGILASEP